MEHQKSHTSAPLHTSNQWQLQPNLSPHVFHGTGKILVTLFRTESPFPHTASELSRRFTPKFLKRSAISHTHLHSHLQDLEFVQFHLLHHPLLLCAACCLRQREHLRTTGRNIVTISTPFSHYVWCTYSDMHDGQKRTQSQNSDCVRTIARHVHVLVLFGTLKRHIDGRQSRCLNHSPP